MSREEIENRILSILVDENNLFCNTSCSIEDMDCPHCNTVMKSLVTVFITHEQDTLKEFVEWYKEVLGKDFDKVMEKSKESKIAERCYWYRQGQATAFRRTIGNIGSNLEKFLEERK